MRPLDTSATAASRQHGAGPALPGAGTCLVVDAGRTGCRAVLYAGDGDAGDGVVAGPGLPGVADGEGSAEPFVAVLAPLLRQLSLTSRPPSSRSSPGRPLDAVCVGMTGVLRPGPAAAAVADAVHALLPVRRVLVTSDVVTGYCGAVGLGPGVVAAAGTGVIAIALGERGVARVDGWGYIL
ncbi:MAG TPA: hypothetical protein VEP73_10210, partial [Actinomycetota bacterium]|nr:hypothetical protein [Actinomycetota bacterium]